MEPLQLWTVVMASDGETLMRACFLGQNVCALGFGVAMVQSPPAPDEPKPNAPLPLAPDDQPVVIPPRLNRMFEGLRRQTPHYS